MVAVPSFDLSGKVAVVSGASRGIGASIAHAFAAHGAHVIVVSRRIEGCEAVVSEIRGAGGSAEAIACNIGEMEAISALFSRVAESHGRLDILVNNAATNPHFGPIFETDLAAFQKTVDVNIRGYFFMSAGAVKLMKKGGDGAIINVASVNAFIPGPMQGIYSITKAAIISMTQAFARECAPLGIRVNALAPGATDTKFAATLVHNPVIRDKALEHIPLNRIARPEELAGAALYLASPCASYTTGSCLVVDGGYLVA